MKEAEMKNRVRVLADVNKIRNRTRKITAELKELNKMMDTTLERVRNQNMFPKDKFNGTKLKANIKGMGNINNKE